MQRASMRCQPLTHAACSRHNLPVPLVLSEITDPARLRRVAAHQLGRLEVGAVATDDQMVRTSSWLTAALFAINGGGVLATINVIEKLDMPVWPAGAFIAGIMFAMLSAVLIQQFTEAVRQPVEDLLVFWREVEATGELPSDYDELTKPIRKWGRWHWAAPTAGWLSGVLFLCGAVVLGTDAASPPRSLALRCATFQADMVRLHPTYPDSRELFQTLRCTPH